MSAVCMAPGVKEMGASECDDGDVDPTPQEGCAKAPHFGAGEGGEVVQYTEYIDNAKKTKNLQSGFEPLVNGEGQERPSSVAKAPAHPKADHQARTSARRGNQAFDAWEAGDKNYKVYFDEARDSKHSGKKINLNDPQENPNMFLPIKDSAQTQPRTRGDKRRAQVKVPKFGAWDNGDSHGYTQAFEYYGGRNTEPSLGMAEGNIRFTTVRQGREQPVLNSDTLRNYGRAPWMRDLYVDSCRHQPSVNEDAYGGGSRTRYDQILLGNESKAAQANVASTAQSLMPSMITIHQPEQKPTKQKGRRLLWLRRKGCWQ